MPIQVSLNEISEEVKHVWPSVLEISLKKWLDIMHEHHSLLSIGCTFCSTVMPNSIDLFYTKARNGLKMSIVQPSFQTLCCDLFIIIFHVYNNCACVDHSGLVVKYLHVKHSAELCLCTHFILELVFWKETITVPTSAVWLPHPCLSLVWPDNFKLLMSA